MAKVIINADDFGMNPHVNTQIENALKDDVITSTTILANTCTPDTVVRVVDELRKTKSFGAHLNLTQGKCLTESAAFHKVGLVDDDNNFTSTPRQVVWTTELLLDVYNEWKTQIRVIKALGIPISHIDGHHHIHNDSVFQPLLFQICHEEGINKIRHIFFRPVSWRILSIVNRTKGKIINSSTDNQTTNTAQLSTSNDSTHVNHLSVLYNQMQWKRRVKQAGIKTTDYFGSYKSYYQFYENGMRLWKNDVVELMCHPGSNSTIEEMALIKDRALERFSDNIVYLNYNQL